MKTGKLLIAVLVLSLAVAGCGGSQGTDQAAADQALAAAKAKNGTTLAGYKTLDICAVSDSTWRYSGVIAVWNEGAIDTENFTINDFIESKASGPVWTKAYDVFVNNTPGEIPAGTTLATALTFTYSIDRAPLEGDIRNNATLTITNHSGKLGVTFGPNPKATYAGTMPPPACNQECGCTFTQGYWGNKPGVVWPSPYDRNAFFFLLSASETTWQQVLDTEPRGNGYYILAHHYIAAVLNKANGACVPQGIQDTLDLASAWFAANGLGACSGPGSCGMQKDWAGVLDDYNNGEYPGGPSHCDE